MAKHMGTVTIDGLLARFKSENTEFCYPAYLRIENEVYEAFAHGNYNVVYKSRSGKTVFKTGMPVPQQGGVSITDTPDRSVRIFNEINQHTRYATAHVLTSKPFPCDAQGVLRDLTTGQSVKIPIEGWIAPFIAGKHPETLKPMIPKVIELYMSTGRILIDAIVKENFIVDEQGVVVFIDPGLVLQLEQREMHGLEKSIASITWWYDQKKEDVVFDWINEKIESAKNISKQGSTKEKRNRALARIEMADILCALLFLKTHRPDITEISALQDSRNKDLLKELSYAYTHRIRPNTEFFNELDKKLDKQFPLSIKELRRQNPFLNVLLQENTLQLTDVQIQELAKAPHLSQIHIDALKKSIQGGGTTDKAILLIRHSTAAQIALTEKLPSLKKDQTITDTQAMVAKAMAFYLTDKHIEVLSLSKNARDFSSYDETQIATEICQLNEAQVNIQCVCYQHGVSIEKTRLLSEDFRDIIFFKKIQWAINQLLTLGIHIDMLIEQIKCFRKNNTMESGFEEINEFLSTISPDEKKYCCYLFNKKQYLFFSIKHEMWFIRHLSDLCKDFLFKHYEIGFTAKSLVALSSNQITTITPENLNTLSLLVRKAGLVPDHALLVLKQHKEISLTDDCEIPNCAPNVLAVIAMYTENNDIFRQLLARVTKENMPSHNIILEAAINNNHFLGDPDRIEILKTRLSELESEINIRNPEKTQYAELCFLYYFVHEPKVLPSMEKLLVQKALVKNSSATGPFFLKLADSKNPEILTHIAAQTEDDSVMLQILYNQSKSIEAVRFIAKKIKGLPDGEPIFVLLDYILQQNGDDAGMLIALAQNPLADDKLLKNIAITQLALTEDSRIYSAVQAHPLYQNNAQLRNTIEKIRAKITPPMPKNIAALIQQHQRQSGPFNNRGPFGTLNAPPPSESTMNCNTSVKTPKN